MRSVIVGGKVGIDVDEVVVFLPADVD